MNMKFSFGIFLLCLLAAGCEKEPAPERTVLSDYSGAYTHVEYTESLIGDFAPGIYREDDIPEALTQLTLGRIEIDFVYNGGALSSFAPILYYGSVNKNEEDNLREETQFHLVVEIGHYNVIPNPVENLFYTVCYDRYPVYCRDTYFPVIAGEQYTFILDKKPEGIILHLKRDNELVNSFPSAYFPDSTQVFFKEVSDHIGKVRGDSLETVFMVGKGYVGFAPGIHTFNGEVSGIKIYKYTPIETNSGYELLHVKNQHFEGQEISYSIRDKITGHGNTINMLYNFTPYVYSQGIFTPSGNTKSFEDRGIQHDQEFTRRLTSEDIGYYQIYLETFDDEGNLLNATDQPFEVWVYPREWEFDY